MASTRMRISTNSQVFHRVAASGDMAEHDVGSTDTVATGMGGSADFELESDSTVTHVSASKVADATGGGAAIGSAAIADYIYIKNTGYEEAAKSTSTTANLKVGIGDPDVNGFTLAAGEAITLHGLGTGCDNLSEIYLETSTGNIYAEVVYL